MRESNILWSPTCSLWCSSLIITAIWMMDLEALLKVQMGLLHPLANGPNLQLHGEDRLLHGGHPSLNSS
jgi:hypothetical protein